MTEQEVMNNGSEMTHAQEEERQQIYGEYAKETLGIVLIQVDDVKVTLSYPLTHDGIVGALVGATSLDSFAAERWAKKANMVAAVTLGEEFDPLAYAKAQKMIDITERDNSSAVNGFTLGGGEHWIPREMRDMFQDRLTQEVRRGHDTVSLDLPDAAEGAEPLTLNVQTAQQMLDALNDYATDCYDQTQQHKRNVAALKTVKKVEQYDYTTGYPEKIDFDTLFAAAQEAAE